MHEVVRRDIVKLLEWNPNLPDSSDNIKSVFGCYSRVYGSGKSSGCQAHLFNLISI